MSNTLSTQTVESIKESYFQLENSEIIPKIISKKNITKEFLSNTLLHEMITIDDSSVCFIGYCFSNNENEFIKIQGNIRNSMLPEIERLSMEYINSKDFTFNTFNGNDRILTIDMSELVLSEHQMAKVHSQWKTNTIIVSVPRTGHLYVMDNDMTSYENEEEYQKTKREFVDNHWKVWNNDQSSDDQLTQSILVVNDGIIGGIVDWDEISEYMSKSDYAKLYMAEEEGLVEEHGEEICFTKSELNGETLMTSWQDFIGYPVIIPDPKFVEELKLDVTDYSLSKNSDVTNINSFYRNTKDVIDMLKKMDEVDVYETAQLPIKYYTVYIGYDTALSVKVKNALMELPKKSDKVTC